MIAANLPWRPLAALTVAVLLAHAALLRVPHANVAPHDDIAAPAPFTMRSIVAEAPVPAEDKPAALSPARPEPATPAPHAAPPRQAPRSMPPPREDDAPPVASAAAPAPPSAPAAEPPAPAAPADTSPAAASRMPPSQRDAGPRANAFAVAAPVELRYTVTGEARHQPYSADATLSWRHNGSEYSARMDISLFLLRRAQTSVGRIGEDGLSPTRFGDISRSEQAAHFERDKGKITFSANTPDAPLLAGAQDRLSVLLQIGAMLAGEPSKYPEGTTITVQTVSAREADTWLFTVEGAETLNLNGREFATVKLTRNPRREFDQKVEVWLAPRMDYLPVRLRLTQPGGDYADQQWVSTGRP